MQIETETDALRQLHDKLMKLGTPAPMPDWLSEIVWS
jgi:hypothetical protein